MGRMRPYVYDLAVTRPLPTHTRRYLNCISTCTREHAQSAHTHLVLIMTLPSPPSFPRRPPLNRFITSRQPYYGHAAPPLPHRFYPYTHDLIQAGSGGDRLYSMVMNAKGFPQTGGTENAPDTKGVLSSLKYYTKDALGNRYKGKGHLEHVSRGSPVVASVNKGGPGGAYTLDRIPEPAYGASHRGAQPNTPFPSPRMHSEPHPMHGYSGNNHGTPNMGGYRRQAMMPRGQPPPAGGMWARGQGYGGVQQQQQQQQQQQPSMMRQPGGAGATGYPQSFMAQQPRTMQMPQMGVPQSQMYAQPYSAPGQPMQVQMQMVPQMYQPGQMQMMGQQGMMGQGMMSAQPVQMMPQMVQMMPQAAMPHMGGNSGFNNGFAARPYPRCVRGV